MESCYLVPSGNIVAAGSFVCVTAQVVFVLSNVLSNFYTGDNVFEDPFCIFYFGSDNLLKN